MEQKTSPINDRLILTEGKHGLRFGTDAYLLSAFIKKGKKGCELGCGSGVISLFLLAREKATEIFAFDVQKDYAELTQKNADDNNITGLHVFHRDIREVGIADTDGECDFVFSNPPYMKTNSGKENTYTEKEIARHEVMGDISDFCACAGRLLKSGGAFYVVYRPDRLIDLIFALRESRLEPKVLRFVSADTGTEPSMLLLECKKDAKCGLRILPTLYLHEDSTKKDLQRHLTKEAEEIYRTGSMVR